MGNESIRQPSVVRSARATAGALAIGAALAFLVWTATGILRAAGPDEQKRAVPLEVREPRVVVLKSKRVLYLFDGSTLVRTYRIALGSSPKGTKLKQDDGRTPEGVFRICTKNPDSEYTRFMGISYPDPDTAARGLREGLISKGEFESILEAHSAGRCPSWSTALGGGVGIHGHGAARDWTAGCIALADQDAEELFSVLRLGDSVEILP